MTAKRTIRLGAEEVPYTVERTARRTLGITVHPDGTVAVTAPYNVEVEAIETRLRKRGAWVLKTLRDFERLRPRTPARLYRSGETHRFLGRQYRLLADSAAPRGVSLTHDHIVVGGVGADEPGRAKNRLELWYQREARRVFAERLDACLAIAGVTVRPPRLVVRPMDKRWGSLSASGRSLLINRRLVEADVECIDFVIIHELCHLSHHHHGSEFWVLLSDRLPDWEARKARLERWML